MQNGHLIEAGVLKNSAFLKSLMHGRGFSSVFRHQYLKTQPLSVGFFSARSASVGAVPGVGIFSATPLMVPVSGSFGPVFSLCSLSGQARARCR